MAGERITGALGKRMTEAALTALMPPSDSGVFGGWAGGATDLGVQWPRDSWRHAMRRALEAAFNELLKDTDHA